MYVRIFLAHEIERWNVNSLDELPILALEPWNSRDDSDYSIFKINSNVKDENSNWIVLRALADNFNKRCGGVDLLILSQELLDQFIVKNDDDIKLNCLHANIKNVTYKQFLLIVEYTYKKYKNILSYSIKNIKDLIYGLTDNEFAMLIRYYHDRHPEEKEAKFKSKLRNTYFKDGLNVPLFLTH